jgi:hypothetical protein
VPPDENFNGHHDALRAPVKTATLITIKSNLSIPTHKAIVKTKFVLEEA